MKKIYLPLLATLVLAGCTQSELSESPVNAGVELKFKSTALAVDAGTRAPFEGTEGTALNPLVTKVLVKTGADYGTLYNAADTKITFADVNPTGFAVTKYYYPATGTSVNICGLYPYEGVAPNAAAWTINGALGEAYFTFNGSHDVMAAPQVTSSKADVQAATPTYPTLAFKHLLTLLKVHVVAATDAAITAWGKITKIELVNANSGVSTGVAPLSRATVNLTAGTAATGTFATGLNPFPFYTVSGGTVYDETAFTGQTLDLTTTSTLAAYSLVAPVTADGTEDFVLKVYAQNAPAGGVSVPIGLLTTGGATYSGDTQGKAFTITLTFKATEITPKASVTAWDNGGKSDPEIK